MSRLLLLTSLSGIAWFFAGHWRTVAQVSRTAAHEDAIAFRVIFGARQAGAKPYDGTVSVAAGGLLSLAPWRFFGDDKLTGPASWKLGIKRAPIEGDRPVPLADGAALQMNLVPAGLIVTVSRSTTAVAFRTRQGDFTVRVVSLRYGRPLTFLDGDVTVERVPAAVRRSGSQDEQHDYPSLTVTRAGTAWLAWQAYRNPGDHVYARSPGGAVERVTSEAGDVFGTAIGEDRNGGIHVV